MLDISEAALARARQRLGARASQIRWVAADITAIEDLGKFDVWHDRAVFHSSPTPGIDENIALAERSVPVGGHLVVGTFALNGPEKCSGLLVERYDGKKLDAEFGPRFARTRRWPKSTSLHGANRSSLITRCSSGSAEVNALLDRASD